MDNQVHITHPFAATGCEVGRNDDRKIDHLKYADHDTNDRGKFPQFAPGKYLHSVHYPEAGTTLLEVKQWAAGLLKMLNVPHFGRSTQVTVVVKQLLELVHDGNLWIGSEKIAIDGELIHRITGFLKGGPDPRIEFVGKHEDAKLAQHIRTASV